MRTIHIDKYYTSMEHMLKVFDTETRKLHFKAESISEYEEWKRTARTKLKEITGIDRMQLCDLKPELLESEQLDGYRRDKMLIQTEPDVWMPFYVLIPDGIGKSVKRACMLAPHGHCGGGKFPVAGRTDIPAAKDMIDLCNYDYGLGFVKRGYVTFCPDARASGERREWMGQSDEEQLFLNSTCIQLNHIAICLGQSVTGMWTWDLMRLLDYIEAREDCDPGRIGCGGLSGGGLQTLWLAAMDDRVRCSLISGYFYGYRDALLKGNDNCGCNYIPHLWEYADMGDIGALIAPRPLFIESGTKDPCNGESGIANAEGQVETTRKAYKLLCVDDRLYHNVFEGEHIWKGDKSYLFLEQWL